MANISGNISSLKYYERALNNLGKKAFPRAVGSTLNDMAFETKGTKSRRGNIDKRAESMFQYRRSKTIFKAITAVERAKGYDINKMQAGAGIYKKAKKDRIASDVAHHDQARPIDRTYTPLKKARISSNQARRIRGKAKHKALNYIDVTRMRSNQRIRTIIWASKRGIPILIKGVNGKARGKKFVARPLKTYKEFLGRDGEVGGRRQTLQFLYKKNEDKKVHLKRRTPFVTLAAMDSAKNVDKYFIKNVDWALKNIKV